MLLPLLLSTAALTLTANAFLVPLEVANKATSTLELPTKPLSEGQVIALNCASCPFAAAQKDSKNGYVWKTDGPQTDLVMEFTTDRKSLYLNGVPFYPAWPHSAMPRAKQIVKANQDVKDLEQYSGDFGLSYSLELDPSPKKTFTTDKGRVSYVTVTMNVLGLDGRMINTDAIDVHVVKTADDELLFQSISTGPSPLNVYSKNCTTIFCRVRAIIFAKIQTIRQAATKTAHRIKGGCMRKLGFRPHPKHVATKIHGSADQVAHKHHGSQAPKQHTGRPEHHEGKLPHGHPGKAHFKHRHPGMRKFVCSLKRAFKHVILPILIGVAAGMAASAVGILVGQVVVLAWMRYRRGSRSLYLPVTQVEDGMEKEDGLPKYEDVAEGGTEADVDTDEKGELLG